MHLAWESAQTEAAAAAAAAATVAAAAAECARFDESNHPWYQLFKKILASSFKLNVASFSSMLNG